MKKRLALSHVLSSVSPALSSVSLVLSSVSLVLSYPICHASPPEVIQLVRKMLRPNLVQQRAKQTV